MSVTTVRLQAEVEAHLDAIAKRLHRSKGWVINQALAEYIEKQRLEQWSHLLPMLPKYPQPSRQAKKFPQSQQTKALVFAD